MTKKSVTEAMKAMNTYKPEFEPIIEIYVGLNNQYKKLLTKFKAVGYKVEESTGYSDNSKKSPLVSTMENLRKDILKYANELGLTPAGLKRLNEKNKTKSAGGNFLDSLLNG